MGTYLGAHCNSPLPLYSSLTEPVAEPGFAEFSRGQFFDGLHRIMWIEFQAISVLREKEARDNPSRALVAVNQRVITNNSISIRPS